MVLIPMGLAAWAAFRFYAGGADSLMWIAIISGALVFWGGGVAANFGPHEAPPAYAQAFWVLGLIGAIIMIVASFIIL